jgi:hypothetical protein
MDEVTIRNGDVELVVSINGYGQFCIRLCHDAESDPQYTELCVFSKGGNIKKVSQVLIGEAK